jgi:hypothetical protein
MMPAMLVRSPPLMQFSVFESHSSEAASFHLLMPKLPVTSSSSTSPKHRTS